MSELVHLTCSLCGREHPSGCRPSTAKRIRKQYQYLVCPDCDHLKPERQEDEVIVIDVIAFAGWQGWNVRKATPEEQASIRRAQAIRDIGLRMLKEQQVDQWIQEALDSNHDDREE